MVISKNKVVSIDYTLKNESGETIDSSVGGAPLVYIQGIGNLISGLEEELEGKKINDAVSAVIPPEKGYGVFNKDFIQNIPIEEFADFKDLQVGLELEIEMNGDIRIAKVKSILGNMVQIDANHPLSGMTLYFDVVVKSIREATKSELSHGHVHGEGGHHH
jgi:FKBP-type peptidyl-prolyl cis-trans isomerase SlyD